MNREEAARILDPSTSDSEFEKDISHWSERLDIAMAMGAESLRGPWVKTADRLPTEADAGYNEEVITFYRDGETESVSCDYWAFVAKHPEYSPYWMPIPLLPGVEE